MKYLSGKFHEKFVRKISCKVALAAWSEFAVTTHITNMTPVFIVFIVK